MFAAHLNARATSKPRPHTRQETGRGAVAAFLDGRKWCHSVTVWSLAFPLRLMLLRLVQAAAQGRGGGHTPGEGSVRAAASASLCRAGSSLLTSDPVPPRELLCGAPSPTPPPEAGPSHADRRLEGLFRVSMMAAPSGMPPIPGPMLLKVGSSVDLHQRHSQSSDSWSHISPLKEGDQKSW